VREMHAILGNEEGQSRNLKYIYIYERRELKIKNQEREGGSQQERKKMS